MNTPVLIVGAGPTGLSTAIALARQGIRSLVVERHPSTTTHPKARAVNVRTMEIFRRWGVEKAVCDRALPQDFLRFLWCKTLAGEEIARVETLEGRRSENSPTVRRIVSQDVVEEALYRHAGTLPEVQLSFSTELESLEENANGVKAQLIDGTTGARTTCRAAYLVAADGATSTVRRQLGIPMQGSPCLSHQMSVYFRADLTQWTDPRPADIYYCTEGDWIGVVNGKDRWLCIARYEPDAGESARHQTVEDHVARIRRSVGVPDLPVDVINTTFWKMGAQVAERFRSERVFLAGDAAHVMSPTGGFGMNTGIQDGHNLGWKLAAVLQGWGGPGLLDSYEVERRPVAESNAAWSAENARRIWRILDSVSADDTESVRAGVEGQIDQISSEGRALGFQYRSATILGNGSVSAASPTQRYRPTGAPGCRAPHVWLHGRDSRFSSLDLFDRHFVLLTATPVNGWHSAWEALTPRVRSQVRPVTIGEDGDFRDLDKRFLDLYGLERSGAILVRPDGHIAWRSPEKTADPALALPHAVDCALGLGPTKRRSEG